jgi:chromosome partitioning protein
VTKQSACKVIAIVNQKGGVGKTTTATNLATALAATFMKTLIIDFDPQGNASTGLGIGYDQRKINIYDVLVNDASIKTATITTSIPLLSVVPATVDLSAAEIEIINVKKREFILKEKLAAASGDYDYIIIDCPPSLGLLTINALCAADSLIIPLQCEFFALEGLSHLLKTVELVKKNLNTALYVRGILLTMYDKRNKLTEQVEEDVRECLGDMVFRTVIPRNVRVSEAPSHGKPALIYDLKCSGSLAYLHLVREILANNKQSAA